MLRTRTSNPNTRLPTGREPPFANDWYPNEEELRTSVYAMPDERSNGRYWTHGYFVRREWAITDTGSLTARLEDEFRLLVDRSAPGRRLDTESDVACRSTAAVDELLPRVPDSDSA